MSKDTVALNMPIPKAVHEKAKADAKAAGVNLKSHVIALIEGGEAEGDTPLQSDLIKILSAPRTTDQFGEETILQEILRRTISIQLMAAERLTEDKGVDAARRATERLDGITKAIIGQRSG